MIVSRKKLNWGITVHRGQTFSSIIKAGPDEATPNIGGIPIVAVKLQGGWFVVAEAIHNDAKFPDRGPFPTAKQAMVYIQLAKD